MEYTLWVNDKDGKIVHLRRYQTLKEAEQELHMQNSYAGGEGRLFRIYKIPDLHQREDGSWQYTGRTELVQRISTI